MTHRQKQWLIRILVGGLIGIAALIPVGGLLNDLVSGGLIAMGTHTHFRLVSYDLERLAGPAALAVQLGLYFLMGAVVGVSTLPFADDGATLVRRSLAHFAVTAGVLALMVCLCGWKGWAMFGTVWAAAVLGVVLNAVSVERFKKVSMACYLAMGWVVVLAMGDFYRAASPLSFWCLLAGGILYTVGAALYGVGKKIPYIHPVFHLFVLAGSALQYFCVLLYCL